MKTRSGLLGLATMALVLGNAGPALAVDLYVDDSGSNSGDCTVPATPCKSIEFAHDQPGADDVIHLGGGTYAENAVLAGSESLIEDSTFTAAAAGSAVLDNSSLTPPSMPALFLSSTGTVSGLTIVSEVRGVTITAAGTLSGNTFAFDNPTGIYEADVVVESFATGNPMITGNTFTDPNPETMNPGQTAVVLNSATSPTVSGNTFSGFFQAIAALSGSAASPTISGNVITGTHDTTSGGSAISASGMISPIITANNIHSPGAGAPDGIFVSSAGATLRRNRVIAHDKGLVVSGATGTVTMSSDLIAKSVTRGVDIVSNSNSMSVDADNITVIDTMSGMGDIKVGTGTGLILDSSIVGGGGGANGPLGIEAEGSGMCAISFSRGNGDPGIGNNCDDGFVTADPMFVNRAASDYHLLAGSPMIDMGNPASPAPGTLDIDGDDRALAVAAQCTVPPAGARDIGADEFVTTCPPPVVNPTPPAATPPAKKKCKKGRKLKKGKCVKKKRKKKR